VPLKEEGNLDLHKQKVCVKVETQIGVMPKSRNSWATKRRKMEERHNMPQARKMAKLCHHLDFGLLTSRTVVYLLFQASQCIPLLCCGSPGKLIQWSK
jgi:hypothetical protein